MAEAGKTTAPLTAGIREILVQEEPVFDDVPWETLPMGQSQFKYWQETQLPTTSWRAVNSTYDADYGIIIPQTENLSILGGEVEIDRFLISTMGGELAPGLKARQYRMKAISAKEQWLTALFEGDPTVDPNIFTGFRPRVSGTSLDYEMHASEATALTLEKIDEVLDAVIGGPSAMYSNQWVRRKVNALMRAAGQAYEEVSGSFGRQYPTYAGVMMKVIQRENDMTSILDFDEDPGDGGDDAASMYFVKWGEDYCHGILGNGGAWEVEDFGEQEAAPRHLGRLEVYVGLVTRHPRSLARLHAIGQL